MNGIDGAFQGPFGTGLNEFLFGLAMMIALNTLAWDWVAKRNQVIRYAFDHNPWYRRIAGLIDFTAYFAALILFDHIGMSPALGIGISVVIGSVCGLLFGFICGLVLIERLRATTIARMIQDREGALIYRLSNTAAACEMPDCERITTRQVIIPGIPESTMYVCIGHTDDDARRYAERLALSIGGDEVRAKLAKANS